MFIVIMACGGSNNLQVTVAAQNTQIAESQPSPTNEGSSNEISPTATSAQTSNNSLIGSFPLLDGFIGYPIKHMVGDENSSSEGFRKVTLELFVQNISNSLASSGLDIQALRAILTDSNQFTQRCYHDSQQEMIGGYTFPPNFGVPYALSCEMPNNASVDSFTITSNGEELGSFPASPDGTYNTAPSLDDMVGDQFASGGVATIDNIAQIELVSANHDPNYLFQGTSDAWIVSLKIKNNYGASITFGWPNGIVRYFQITSDLGFSTLIFPDTGPDSSWEIPPGGEATWDFAIVAKPSPNTALLVVLARAPNDPAYNSGELMYTLFRFPPP